MEERQGAQQGRRHHAGEYLQSILSRNMRTMVEGEFPGNESQTCVRSGESLEPQGSVRTL
ncbi:Hypothetical predicted protein, partial [Marmota monax]